MAISRIERLSSLIAQPQLSSGQRRALLARTIANDANAYNAINDLADAITVVKDERIRAELGGQLWAQLNTPRIVLGKELPRNAPLITAVLFTVDDSSLIIRESAEPLMALTGPLDAPMFSLKDPLQPDIPPLLLVIPVAYLNFPRGFALNYMLGNPQRTEMDAAYHEVWAQASIAPASATNTFAYLFLSTNENTTFEQATSPSASPDLGARTQSVLDLITQHANKLNGQMPGLNMQVVEVCSLSRAVLKGTELRIRKAMLDHKHVLGKYITGEEEGHADPDDMIHGDIYREAMAEFRSQHAGKSQTPDEIFGKAIIGLSCFQDTGSEQLGQCLMLSKYGVPNICLSIAMPQGITSAMLATWWRETIDPQERAQLVLLPSVVLKKPPLAGDGQSLYRDEKGEWTELSLLKLVEARKLFRTASWAGAIGASQAPINGPNQVVEVPHPRLVQQALDLERAARAHFAPEVAQTLLSLTAQPGRSHEWMRTMMLEAYPDLLGAQSVLPHPTDAFMPAGFWSALHFQRAAGVVFRLRRTFQQAMEESDFKGSFPFLMLRCPYPDIYIQFAKPLKLNTESVLGAYCSEATYSEQECADAGYTTGTRTVSIMLAVTHLGGISPELLGRDFTIGPDDDQDLASVLRQAMKTAADAAAASPLNGAPSLVEAEQEAARFESVIFLVLKTLLYVGMKSARTELHLDAKSLRERARDAKGSERDKLMRKAAATYDHIVIGPEVSEAEQRQRASAEYMKSVWHVRGYFQPVRFGPGRQQMRSDWQAPSFRHRHSLQNDGTPPPDPKDYEIK